jgi:hypothetical protein
VAVKLTSVPKQEVTLAPALTVGVRLTVKVTATLEFELHVAPELYEIVRMPSPNNAPCVCTTF